MQIHRLAAVLGTFLLLGACTKVSNPGDGDDPDTVACTDGQTTCVGTEYQTCDNGTFTTSEVCSDVCDSKLGCVACVPGQDHCSGNSVYSCDDSGNQGGLVVACTGEEICSGGNCIDACTEAAENRSYIGCEYYAVDNDNAIEVIDTPVDGTCDQIAPGSVERSDLFFCHDPDATGFPPLIPIRRTAGLCDPDGSCPSGYACEQAPVCVLDAQNSPFAIVVSNPHTSTVDVTISDALGTSETFTLQSGEVKSILPQELGFADHSIDGTSIAAAAYKIVSTAPVVAYQFNPLDNVDVFSNDGSLLIASHAYDQKYLAMTWPTLERRSGGTHNYHGYVTVVAWQDDTQITVKTTADVVGGNAGVSAFSSGQNKTFTLNAMDVLNIEAVADGDLTGSVVEAANGKTFGVFAGHEAILLQNTESSCCADHIEEMMFPASTWGKEFVLARSQDRGKQEPDLIRVLAQKSGTTVTFDPAPIEGSCPTLGEGRYCDVKIMVDTQIMSNEPVLIGHYLLSVMEQDLFTSSGIGDPSLALAVPAEQFRSAYDFLVPSEYEKQYISISAKTGTNVLLDGVSVTGSMTAVGGSDYSAGRIEVQPGQHRLECPDGSCGIEIYGYSSAVSYLFAGGLDLQRIAIE